MIDSTAPSEENNRATFQALTPLMSPMRIKRPSQNNIENCIANLSPIQANNAASIRPTIANNRENCTTNLSPIQAGNVASILPIEENRACSTALTSPKKVKVCSIAPTMSPICASPAPVMCAEEKPPLTIKRPIDVANNPHIMTLRNYSVNQNKKPEQLTYEFLLQNKITDKIFLFNFVLLIRSNTEQNRLNVVKKRRTTRNSQETAAKVEYEQ